MQIIKSVIKLDYDIPMNEWVWKNSFSWWKRLRIVESILNINFDDCIFEESKGGNTHVTIYVSEDFSDLEVLAIQAILGSDYIREAFNFTRIKAGQKNWDILFDGKPYMSKTGHIKGAL